jgi:hypothetical protein
MPRHTAAALGAALAAAALTACASTTSPAATAPAPTTSAAAPATSTPASPTTAASTTGSGGLAAWYTTTGKDIVNNLDTEAKQLNSDKNSPDDLSFDCVSIDNTEQDAEKASPPPSSTVAPGWKTALQQIRQGWWDCNGGKTTVGLAEIGTGVTELDAVDSVIRSAIAH